MKKLFNSRKVNTVVPPPFVTAFLNVSHAVLSYDSTHDQIKCDLIVSRLRTSVYRLVL